MNFRTPEEKDVAEKKFMQVHLRIVFPFFLYLLPECYVGFRISQVATAYETLREDESRADYDYMLVSNVHMFGLMDILPNSFIFLHGRCIALH